MLEMLVRNRGKLVGREELLKEVWGPAYAKETHYLRVYLAQLRRKLEDDPSHPKHLLTEAGHGLPLRASDAAVGRQSTARRRGRAARAGPARRCGSSLEQSVGDQRRDRRDERAAGEPVLLGLGRRTPSATPSTNCCWSSRRLAIACGPAA